MALVAEEERRPADAAREFQEARDWALVWRSGATLELLIRAREAGEWSLQDAREGGYEYLKACLRHPTYR